MARRLAHPHAMQPARPGPTRTAPPRMPAEFPMRGRYAAYVLFDATGLVYFVLGLLALRLVWALGSGEAAWSQALAGLHHPFTLAFHVFALVCLLLAGKRFFRLFPKAQPPTIGPAKPPPGPVIHATLYAVWAGVTVVLCAILAGGIFG